MMNIHTLYTYCEQDNLHTMRMRKTNLYIHNPGIYDMDFVPVATPNLVVHNMHAADWVVGLAQVQ